MTRNQTVSCQVKMSDIKLQIAMWILQVITKVYIAKSLWNKNAA